MKPNDIKAAFEEAHLDMRFCYDKDNQGQYLDPVVNDHYRSFLAGCLFANELRFGSGNKEVKHD